MDSASVAWLPLAWTGTRLADFQPYVPAIDDSGAVVFQAGLAGGASGVFVARGDAVESLFPTMPEHQVSSHPDRNARGDACVYVTRQDGSSAVIGVQQGRPISYADSRHGVFAGIAPLGPVMDADGSVGFRASLADGGEAVCAWVGGEVHVLARTGEQFTAFHGLPVIRGAAAVLFRADTCDGLQGLYRATGSRVWPVFERPAAQGRLAFFPTQNASGEVVCGWASVEGDARVLRIREGCEPVDVDTGDIRFESLRGCLMGEGGELCFTGTPRGGRLGLYRVLARGVECLLEEGGLIEGARVQAFALNPVSMNARGRLAVRILLDDGRQLAAASR